VSRSWKLKVQRGGDVEHRSFDELGEAVAAMRARALEIRSEGPLRPVRSLRDFDPAQLVAARLQLSSGRFKRKRVAGVDVKGDGTFVPYRGGLKREELDPTHHETPFELVRETLEER
jgi:hypothetical protein